MNYFSTYEDESRLTQVMPPINNKENEYWSSDAESEDMENTSSNNKDEDIGETPSYDKSKDDMNISPIIKDESRLTQGEPQNNKQKSEVCSGNDESKDMGDTPSNDGSIDDMDKLSDEDDESNHLITY